VLPDPIDRLRAALADRYRLERELGRGGMATVWRARDLRHERDVAIKVLRPELSAAIGADRFQREIRLTAQLQHPNILPVFDSGNADGVLWYAMPLVEGASLRDRLDDVGRLPVGEATVLVAEVAGALAYAHRGGIVHRDIKPENILLAHGHALVADFGIARAVAQSGGDKLTQTGMAIGTGAYMSPEQATADPALDGRADQYSLGCVLHEMLTGEVPFAGTSAPALLARRLTEPVPPLPAEVAVPSSVRGALARALEREPGARFGTLDEFAKSLVDVPAPPAATAPMAVRVPPSGRRTAVAVAVALAGLAVVATVSLRGRLGTEDASTDPSVAVLPFENRSADPEAAYVSDGVANELIVRLTADTSLRVSPRSSVARFRNSSRALEDIAAELGVKHLVTGSVARLADSVRLDVELVDVAGHRQQWARQSVVTRGALAGAVSELAAGIAGSLLPRSRAGASAVAAPITRDSLAYDSYLRGQFLFSRFNEADLRLAVEQFDRAIARDPRFAAAWVGRAGALMAQASGMGRIATVQTIADIRRATDSASALDPRMAMPHALRGLLYTWFDWDWAAAAREMDRALALGSRDALVLQRAAFLFSVRGDHDSALALNARARELEPESALAWAGAANLNFFARRFEAAIAAADRSLALDPRFPPALELRARALSRLGRSLEAITSARRMVAEAPGLAWGHATLAEVLAAADSLRAARAIMDSLELIPEAGRAFPSAMARAHAALDNRDGTIGWLERALRDRSSAIAYVQVEPAYDPLRSDPRFVQLLLDAGLVKRAAPR
jgi:serine/threonine-protein kinase